MIGSGNHQGGNVLVFEHLAHVLLSPGRAFLFALDDLDGGGQNVGVGVTQVGDFDVVEAAEAFEQAATAAVQSHEGEDDLVVWFVGGASGDSGRQAGGGSSVEEVAAVKGAHEEVSQVGAGDALHRPKASPILSP